MRRARAPRVRRPSRSSSSRTASRTGMGSAHPGAPKFLRPDARRADGTRCDVRPGDAAVGRTTRGLPRHAAPDVSPDTPPGSRALVVRNRSGSRCRHRYASAYRRTAACAGMRGPAAGDCRLLGDEPAVATVVLRHRAGRRQASVVPADLDVAHSSSVRRTVTDQRSARGGPRAPGIGCRAGPAGCGDRSGRTPQRRHHAPYTHARMPPGLGDLALLAYDRDMTVRMRTPCT